MKKNEIWQQLHNESNKNYERFNNFLEFNGTLKDFQACLYSDLSLRRIHTLSNTYNWLKRKKAYNLHKQKVVQKTKDKVIKKITEDSVKKSLEDFEKGLPLLTQQFIEVVNEKKLDKLALEFMRNFPSTVEKFLDVKNKLEVKTGKETTELPVFHIGGEFCKIEIKDTEEVKFASD